MNPATVRSLWNPSLWRVRMPMAHDIVGENAEERDLIQILTLMALRRLECAGENPL